MQCQYKTRYYQSGAITKTVFIMQISYQHGEYQFWDEVVEEGMMQHLLAEEIPSVVHEHYF